MLRSISVPLSGLIGLLLAIDGTVAWLAGAPVWGWGIPWAIGTGLLAAVFLIRLGQKVSAGAIIGVIVLVLLLALIYFKGDAIGGIQLDNIPAILIFLVIFIGEIGIGIATILTGRASAQGANFWVYIVASAAVMILINYLSARHLNERYDLTENKIESLSSQTITKLKGLTQDVHVIAFYRDNDPDRTTYAQLLKKYAAVTSRFSFEFVDPDKYPERAKAENANPRGITIIVKSKGRRELVTGTDEKDLTSAIIKATRPGIQKFYFSTWHGEPKLDTDFSALKRALNELDYQTATFNLADGEIPSDCSVFVIAGPKSPFLPIEVEHLEHYLAAGKSLLVMLDPDTVASGLEDLLAKYGAQVEPNVIIERQRGLVPYAGGYYMGETQSLYARTQRYSNQIIVQKLNDNRIPTGFYEAREVRSIPPDSSLYGTSQSLVYAGSPSSFTETDVRSVFNNPRKAYDATGRPTGPFSVAVAMTAKATNPVAPPNAKTRIVVFGDSDFATDRGISQERGNGDLILNSLNWLSEDEDLIAIRPREPGSKPVQLTQSEETFVFLLSVWRYPAIIFIIGLFIWWYRKNRGPDSATA